MTYPASSLTRNAHIAAMSSGRPTRRTGVCADQAGQAPAKMKRLLAK